MKTKFTLITSILIVAALSVVSGSAEAQRRSGRNEAVNEKSKQENTIVQERKSRAVKSNESETKAPATSSSGRRTSVQREKQAPATRTTPAETGRRNNPVSQERKITERQAPQPDNSRGTVKRRVPDSNRSSVEKVPARNERESSRNRITNRNDQRGNAAATPRARTEHNRTIYRVDTRDDRYSPSREYKGNRSNWSVNNARNHVHYNKRGDSFYRTYDHRNYLHWDHSWESYRWNVNSWRDYYSGYHPYSYRYHKHYYYHPSYGHVIRKFSYKPAVFVHHNVRYYNFNGHFFRHFRGVGYVLVDMPYGLVFNHLPDNFERVYINGFLYFRVGNLFFEKHPHGFALIHYPERYFALDDDFYNGGYYREVDYYIYR